MKIKNKSAISAVGALLILLCTVYWMKQGDQEISHDDTIVKEEVSRFERKHLMLPEERFKIRQQLTYREGGVNYQPGYLQKELVKSLAAANVSKSRSVPVNIVERGPSNVPGRARGLIVLPQDDTHMTWLVGSSGGGVWKTTDGGASWIDKSPNFPTLAVTSLAYCESQPDVIYAGTGEYIASAYTNINGDGIFKSLDAGETWTQLASTAGNELWQSVTRVIVDPNNPDVVLASTAPNFWGSYTSNIMKSTDGGLSWNSVFNAQAGAIEQIVASPNDFNILYAGQSGVGVLGSLDAGDTWSLISNGMSPSSRVELAVSPVDPTRLYASVVGGLDASQEADIYYSHDSGNNWTLITDPSNTVDVLGGQGWYDNTILAHPFNLNEFYVGGIGIYKYTVDVAAGVGESDPTFLGTETGGTEAFMARVNFTAELDGGTLALGSAPADEFTSVEIRFGPGRSQKAHRFLVPSGRGSGVGDAEYTYQDYVDVPFEVWDVDATPERQLMVAFRDQQRDGIFNLIYNNTEGGENDANNTHSREYLYINSRTYSETPSDAIATTGGHVDDDLFFIWPYLVAGATWDPDNLPESAFRINWGTVVSGQYDVVSAADPYGRVDGKNSNVHPDHHNLVAVIHDAEAKEWQIVNVNDGASYASNVSANPGVSLNSWHFAGSMMNTTQFYGADKAPGVDRYVAGAQDNGSWFSPSGEDASKTTEYEEAWGGDGFDAVWHPTDINKLIVTSQNLGIGRSIDGGNSFLNATVGLGADPALPFIGQFSNAPQRPDVVFTLAGNGVYKSDDFAGSWELIDMTGYSDWATSSLMSIEISDATPDVMWAGASISNSGSLFLSTDKGESFAPVPDNGINTGLITGIATNYHDYKTVYVLFSYAKSAKVVRSTDLGETWEDISGFSAGSTSTGFPDVAVYDLQVMPHDPNTIWVGSEIGIIESTDNGASWHLLDSNMPRASVWEIDLKEDQLVIASHSRGIWSYTLPEVPLITYYPEITDVSAGLSNEVGVLVNFISDFDSAQLYINGDYASSVVSPDLGENLFTASTSETELEIVVRGFKGSAPYTSDAFEFTTYSFAATQSSYVDRFDTDDDHFTGSMEIKKVTGFPSQAIHSAHNYEANSNKVFNLLIPIEVKSSDATFSYKDVAIVEPGADYVTLEGSTDGISWVTIAKYDASANDKWTAAFESKLSGREDYFVDHEYNLLDHFNAGDVVVFRFRLQSDAQVNSWGWAIDDVAIQGEILAADQILSSLKVFPNPTTDFLAIESQVPLAKVELFGLDGSVKRVSFNNNQLDMRGLRTGIYLLKIVSENGSVQTLRVSKD